MKIVYFILLLTYAIGAYAQERKVYIFKERYTADSRSFSGSIRNGFEDIKIIGGGMIDPKKNGTIDMSSVEKFLVQLFPSVDDEGILCVDLENRIFHNIKDNELSSPIYKKAINEFTGLIKFIKQKRPQLKVGIYGMPFTEYYDSQSRRNIQQKLDPLLKLTDMLFPSLYIFFPEKQKGLNSNINYLDKNLANAFDYGDRLNKPVIPFIWYLVHPTNKRFGYQVIPKKEMNAYVTHISNYRSKSNNKVAGLVWWDTPTPYRNKQIKTNLLTGEVKRTNWTMDSAFSYYFTEEAGYKFNFK